MSVYTNQIIALAGVFQAACLVDKISKTGKIDNQDLTLACNSLFITNPESTAEVYGGEEQIRSNLYIGLALLKQLFNNQIGKKHQGLMNYALSILHLERDLIKRPEILKLIEQRLERIENQATFFTGETGHPHSHPSVVASIANLYQDSLSQLSFRVKVMGNADYLQQQINVEQIRCLLLAGVRSAILWRQLGGKRWHLLFFKSRLNKALKTILAEQKED